MKHFYSVFDSFSMRDIGIGYLRQWSSFSSLACNQRSASFHETWKVWKRYLFFPGILTFPGNVNQQANMKLSLFYFSRNTVFLVFLVLPILVYTSRVPHPLKYKENALTYLKILSSFIPSKFQRTCLSIHEQHYFSGNIRIVQCCEVLRAFLLLQKQLYTYKRITVFLTFS